MAFGGQSQLSPVCAYVAERTGTSLSPQQVARLQEVFLARLQKRSEVEYLEFLKSPKGDPELSELMASISVHKTDLFRDEVQLQAFKKFVLSPLVRTAGRPLRFWSAGCATGEEVATLLILMQEAGANPNSTVLGTDISEVALDQARQLAFPAYIFDRVSPSVRDLYFADDGNQRLKLRSPLRERASFLRHNLMDSPYPMGPSGTQFDVIFCRNVLIYFTEAAFERTVRGLAERLEEGGTLVLSAAEPLLKLQAGLQTFRCENAFFYRKEAACAPRVPPSPLPAISHTPLPRKVQTQLKTPPLPAPERVAAPPPVPLSELNPLDQAMALFTSALEEASQGAPEEKTEVGLRQALYLDPHLAQARYLLGTLLEQRGSKSEAANEYRRALAALNEGKSRNSGFFLNNDRLAQACKKALHRVGG